MSDKTLVVKYLTAPQGGFWEWREQGEVVTWVDDSTIAFRPELAQILARLAPDGLPRFGAILLLLAATRDRWDEPPDKSKALIDLLECATEVWHDWESLTPTFKGLGRVRQLEAELRTNIDARAALVEFVFEGAPKQVPAAQATAIINELRHGLSPDIFVQDDTWTVPSSGHDALLEDLECLEPGLLRVHPDVLKLRRKTGLDQLPEAAELDLPPAEQVRALLKTLVDDDELHGLAKLAHQLMAAVTLPRALAAPDELQVGGVSDISNRGPLDRLLLSELAYDDLTLAIRVAENEAMYLRRESPPQSPPQQRTVFLETGIRSWGVPRVFATAVALAMAATTDRTTEIVTFRAKGDEIEPVDLTTRDGLTAHLSALDPELHPGRATAAMQREMAVAGSVVPPVLVTTEDVLRDNEFQRSLTDHDMAPLHIATVNRDGHFQMVERSFRGSKVLREAQLDLESLFADSASLVPTLVDREWARDLPAIFSVEPFPLLMSHNIDPKRVWSIKDRGALSLAKDHRLLFWEKPGQGGRQLSDVVPAGPIWWSSHETYENQVHAVVGQLDSNGLHLLRIDLERYRCVVQTLDVERGVKGVCSHNGVLFFIFMNRIQVVGLETGDVLQTLELPKGMNWVRSRFFREARGEQWFALSFDGRTAHLENALDDNATQRPKTQCPKLLTLFERDGTDGLNGVTLMGDLYSTSSGNLRKVAHGLNGALGVEGISRDGSRVSLTQFVSAPSLRSKGALIDVDTLKVVTTHVAPNLLITPEISGLVRPTNLRHRFSSICIDADGAITMTSRKQDHLAIVFSAEAERIALQSKPLLVSEAIKTFKPVPTPAEIRIRLARAAWDDGSEAIVDSRGLLHLRSSDRSLPEISIVLTDGELSGWCSDGRLWGDMYFTGSTEGASKRQVFESVVQAFAERVR